MDRRYLRAIALNYGGGPVGIDTMAAALSEQRDTIEETVEPFLLLLREPKTEVSRAEFRNTLQGIVSALKSRRLYLVAAFLFLFSFSPGFGTPLYYYMSDTLAFSQEYIGLLGSISPVKRRPAAS